MMNKVKSRKLKLSRWLSKADKALVRYILKAEIRFFNHKDFAKPDIETSLFSVEVDMREAAADWNKILSHCGTDRILHKRTFLLKVEEEQLLFKQLNYAKKKVCELRKQDVESCVTSRNLIAWWNRVQHLKNMIAAANIALIRGMANKKNIFDRPDADDILSAGFVGLTLSIDYFDVSKGWRFSTYACRAILTHFYGAIERAVIYSGIEWKSRSGLKHSTHLEYFEDREGFSDPTDAKEVERQASSDLIEDIRFVLAQNKGHLTKREYFVIKHRYGLEGETPKTFNEIAPLLNKSHERVRQIEVIAFNKLRPVMIARHNMEGTIALCH